MMRTILVSNLESIVTFVMHDTTLPLPLRPQHHNFEESQEAMKQQLLQLSLLLKALDPELCDYLGEGPSTCCRPHAAGGHLGSASVVPLRLEPK